MGKIVTTEEGIDYWDEFGKEELAFMSKVRWGIIDWDHFPNEPTVGMVVNTLGGSAHIRLTPEQSIQLAVQSSTDDIKDLNGKPCVVVKDNGYIRFLRLYK